MLLALKVFEIDYSFIIKNYLNPELWNKEWTLFVYKSFIFTLKLYSINCKDEKIAFELKLRDSLNIDDYVDDWISNPNESYDHIYFSLKIDDTDFLKRKINSSMIERIKKLEERKVKASTDYQLIQENEQKEEEKLRKIAEAFLDNNNVSNKDIREVYIDSYIDNNKQTDTYLNNMINNFRYNVLTDFYLILGETNKDTSLIEKVKEQAKNKIELENIVQEVNEYMKYIETEDFKEDMESNLEEI